MIALFLSTLSSTLTFGLSTVPDIVITPLKLASEFILGVMTTSELCQEKVLNPGLP